MEFLIIWEFRLIIQKLSPSSAPWTLSASMVILWALQFRLRYWRSFSWFIHPIWYISINQKLPRSWSFIRYCTLSFSWLILWRKNKVSLIFLRSYNRTLRIISSVVIIHNWIIFRKTSMEFKKVISSWIRWRRRKDTSGLLFTRRIYLRLRLLSCLEWLILRYVLRRCYILILQFILVLIQQLLFFFFPFPIIWIANININIRYIMIFNYFLRSYASSLSACSLTWHLSVITAITNVISIISFFILSLLTFNLRRM